MKVLALTTKSPGLRHQAHLWALKEMPIDFVCVEISKRGLLGEKIKRQLKLIPRKGLFSYAKWRLERYTAGPLRQEVGKRISERLANEPFYSFMPTIDRVFDGFTDDLVDYINSQQPELIIQLGVGIVPGYFISLVPPILNLHPGILPGIRGLDPIFWAHYHAREDWFGTTLHLIDEGIDTGKPLLRRRFTPVKNGHFADSICDQIRMEMDLLRLFFSGYPNEYQKFDEGGCEKSIYRSTWSAVQYQDLQAAQWWGPLEKKKGTPKAKQGGGAWKWIPSRESFTGGVSK